MPINLQEYEGSLSSSKELSGIYRARVENNQDPLNIGRVQIRVPMIHGFPNSGISNKSLPWASKSSMSAGYGFGSFIVPEVGEYVFVMFEDGDSSKPVYIGSCFGSGSTNPKTYGLEEGQGTWQSIPGKNEVPIEAQRLDPTRKIVYKSPKGASIEVDEENGSEAVYITDALGQVLKFESNLIDGASHKRDSGDIETSKSRDSGNTSSGSRIALIDAGKQKIEMVTGSDGCKIYIGDADNNGITISPSKDGLKVIANNAGMTITKDGDIKIDGISKVDISSESDVNVSASSITLSGDVTIVGS